MKVVITCLLIVLSMSVYAGEEHQRNIDTLEKRAIQSEQRNRTKRIERLEKLAVEMAETCSANSQSSECMRTTRMFNYICKRQPGPEICESGAIGGKQSLANR